MEKNHISVYSASLTPLNIVIHAGVEEVEGLILESQLILYLCMLTRCGGREKYGICMCVKKRKESSELKRKSIDK